MSNNSQKTPLARSLNAFAEKKASDAIAVLGKALPCSIVAVAGQIVTVSFEIANLPFTLPQVTMPIATWLYDWIPVRKGDQGLSVPSAAYLGGISGLGGGVANLTQRANLATLVFVPVSNKAWAPPGADPLKRVVQGPTGVLLQDLDGKVIASFDGSRGVRISFGDGIFEMTNGGIAITFGPASILMNNTGTSIDGKLFLPHMHTDVQTGGDDTGPVA